MKSIKFTEQELEFPRTQYQLELVEAEKYVTEIKNLLSKFGDKSVKTEPVQEKNSNKGRKKVAPKKEAPAIKGKRGRKPKVQSLPETTEKTEMVSKPPRKPKASKDKTPIIKIPNPIPIPEKSEPTLEKKAILKPKTKKKQQRRKGVVLKSLSKPLPKKDIPLILPEAESPATE